jgi:hypothetical protein
MTNPDQHVTGTHNADHVDHHKTGAHKPVSTKEIAERMKTLPQFHYNPSAKRPSHLVDCLALVSAHVVTYPFTYLKTREQLGLPNSFKQFNFSLFRGVTPFIYGAVTRGSLQWALIPHGSSNDPKKSPAKQLLTMVGPALLALLVSVPVENVQTRMIHAESLATNKYGGVGTVVNDIIKTEGAKGFYRGAIPYTASIGCFGALGLFLLKSKAPGDNFYDFYFKSILPIQLVGSILLNPAEVLKTRLQGVHGHRPETLAQAISQTKVKDLFTKGLVHFTLRNVTFGFLIFHFMSRSF